MTIGAMAQRTGLTESKLRYYEKKGLLQVARDGGGRRDYDEGDVEWVAFICRLKETGGVPPWRSGWRCWRSTGRMYRSSRRNGWSI